MKRLSLTLALVALVAAPAVVFAAEPFSANLTVDQEVPAPTVPGGYAGGGDASVEISDDGTSVAYEVNYHDLTGAPSGSHIHFGAPGEAGGVMLPLDTSAATAATGSFSGTLTEADFVPVDGGPQSFAEALDAIREGNAYVNLHTQANAPGEIRGQLEALPDTASAQEMTTGSPVVLLLVLLAGAVAFVLGLRAFAARRA